MSTKKRILLAGLTYRGPSIPNVEIESRGLGRPEIIDSKAAAALYDYDVIIINPKTYSHFIFGEEGEFSNSINELWELKSKNNDLDLDSVFRDSVREKELVVALKEGSRVVWLMAVEKRSSFFGKRSNYSGYVNHSCIQLMGSAYAEQKTSHKLTIDISPNPFEAYFERLRIDTWHVCISNWRGETKTLASTPEGNALGLELAIGGYRAWLLTPPTSDAATAKLIKASLDIGGGDLRVSKYHDLFLSHTHADKPFVRELKKKLEKRGVGKVWLDEAELMLGDSLQQKIAEGIKKTKYFGVVLSPASIKSNWVKKELEIAMNREIETDKVVVLPLLYQPCELPSFLQGKLYADFTTPTAYKNALAKLLQRLRVTT